MNYVQEQFLTRGTHSLWEGYITWESAIHNMGKCDCVDSIMGFLVPRGPNFIPNT
jgi:hypothetical protein